MSLGAIIVTFVTVLLVEYVAVEAWFINRDRPMCVRDEHGHLRAARSIHRQPQVPHTPAHRRAA